MHPQSPVDTLLPFWTRTLKPPVARETIHADVYRLTTADGLFVLKGIESPPSPEHLAARLDLLEHLRREGIPVAPPIPTDDGAPYVECAERLYILMPALPEGGVPAPEATRWDQIGAAVGRLHRALKRYPRDIPSWTVDWPRAILDEYVPAIRAQLAGAERVAFDEALPDDLYEALAGLPLQRIHGDCHDGNILVYYGAVTGFIDLDHLPIGPRLYDLSWLVTNRSKHLIDDSVPREQWLATLPYLYAGYERENRLGAQERNALWHGVVAFSLLFWAWMLRHGDAHQVESIRKTFYWVVANRARFPDGPPSGTPVPEGALTHKGLGVRDGLLNYLAVFQDTPDFDVHDFLKVCLEPMAAPFAYKYLYLVDTSHSRPEVLVSPHRLDGCVYFNAQQGDALWEGESALYPWTEDMDSGDLWALTTDGNALLFGDTELPAEIRTARELQDAVIDGKLNVLNFTDHVVLHLLLHDTALIDRPPFDGYDLLERPTT